MDGEKTSGRYLFQDDISTRGLVELAKTKTYQLMDIFDHIVLFSEDGFAVVNGQIRNCWVYWLRGGYDDDPGMIATVEKDPVVVNYCGMILTDEEFDFGADGYLEVGPDDWGFHEIGMTISRYLNRRKEDA